MFRFSLQLLSEILLILRRTKQGNIIKVIRSSCPCKVPVIFVKLLGKLKFSTQIFEKNPKTPNFSNIRPVGAELFSANGRTDRRDVANTLRKRLSGQASDSYLLQHWLSRERPKPITITQGSLPAPYPLSRELDRCQIAQPRPAGFH